MLSNLQNIQELKLSAVGVNDLSVLSNFKGLQSLDLSRTRVASLASLSGLDNLLMLNLYGCRPAASADLIRTIVGFPRLGRFVADEVVGVPREILSGAEYINCLPRLKSYLSELDLGAEAENEVKVILLGNGRVGKTQLCRRFRDQPFDDSVESTHGVQIWREELRIQTGGQEQAFQVNWWDFGGQDIYHGTHALFLRSRAVFLILWTPHLENRDEYYGERHSHTQSAARLLARLRADSRRGGQPGDRRAEPVRPVRGPAALLRQGRRVSDFSRAAPTVPRRISAERPSKANSATPCATCSNGTARLEIGQGRAEVRRRLYEWRSKDQKRKPEERHTSDSDPRRVPRALRRRSEASSPGSTPSTTSTIPAWCSTVETLLQPHRPRPGLGARRRLYRLPPRPDGSLAERLGTLYARGSRLQWSGRNTRLRSRGFFSA